MSTRSSSPRRASHRAPSPSSCWSVVQATAAPITLCSVRTTPSHPHRGGSQMNEFVVGVDGSNESRLALRWAAAAADAAGVPVRAVRSWIHSSAVVLPIPEPLAAEKMDEQIREAIGTLAAETL